MVTPWLDDGDVRLYHGDASIILRELPAASVQTCVTSPPYWGLRDYGTGQWEGGDAEHEHDVEPHRNGRGGSGAPGKQTAGAFPSATAAAECSCGARRVDAQLGLEATPDLYVARLVAVFREVRRVLRDDGTLWLNLGDSYATTSGGGQQVAQTNTGAGLAANRVGAGQIPGVKPKDLCGIPWRVAFALQADGWYLRSDIIWAKPNPMPESVTDRPTKSHEYVFLLSKQPRYYYDPDAIREQAAESTAERAHLGKRPISERHEFMQANGMHGKSDSLRDYGRTARNARSVWQIATQPTPEAHFATFPEELARRCILAGTSEMGECAACGAPWQRVTDGRTLYQEPFRERAQKHDALGGTHGKGGRGPKQNFGHVVAQTTGWAASCACDAPTRPQQVLDPFAGSATTLLVARNHGRRSIGIDLSAEYLGIAAQRLQQLSLLV